MNDEEIRDLCLLLMYADTEKDVIELLKEVGYWDDQDSWRYYDDNENNWSTIGNQQSRADAALVEKLVNAVDARLMLECMLRGIDPESPNAPQSIRQAVATFFEEYPNAPGAGLIAEWSDRKRTEVASGITLTATGQKPSEGYPCLTISDSGEGQTPDAMPQTFLSLSKSNKLRIPFVQGKFNMGGTGVLGFCGRHNMQLILTRRHPAILGPRAKDDDRKWGFTLVRREDPTGGKKSSAFTYLAPLGASKNPRRGSVLRFSAEAMPLFPEGRPAYARQAGWGSLLKLYEFALAGYKSHILMPDGLLSRLDLLLPNPGLPMRLYEARTGYKGHRGSFETNLAGLQIRLEDDKQKNLEDSFPSTCSMSISGEPVTARIYVFKRGKAETYRRTEGIIFTVEGQTHANTTTDFFKRKKVGHSYLSDSIFLIVDCTRLSHRSRENLFMNSRDRLRTGELRMEIEQALEEELKNNQLLKDLREARRREMIEEKLEDSRPLEEILDSILKKYPVLSTLFITGKRLSNPFRSTNVKSEQKAFEGKRHPTFFKFKGKDYGDRLNKDCHINMRCRVGFETDAANDYFDRDVEPGESSLCITAQNGFSPVSDYSLNLQNGAATLNVTLPNNVREGDRVDFVCAVTDPSKIEPFRNQFTVTVRPPATSNGGKGERKKPPSKEPGDHRDIPTGIELPHIEEVHEAEWDKHGFDSNTALVVKHAGTAEDNGNAESKSGHDVYDFFRKYGQHFPQVRGENVKRGTPNPCRAVQIRHGPYRAGITSGEPASGQGYAFDFWRNRAGGGVRQYGGSDRHRYPRYSADTPADDRLSRGLGR